MKHLIRIITVVTAMALCLPAVAQPNWKADFKSLADKAEETVEVTLDGKMLNLAVKFLSAEDAEEREIREIVKGLTGIYIYSFTFDSDWAYDRAVAETVRKRIGTGWEQMIKVRSKSKEDVDIWVRPAGNGVDGIFIVAAEPREFTVVNIMGSIDIDKLSRLEGQFGIPDMELEVETKADRRINR